MLRWKLKTRRGKLDLARTRTVWARFREYVRPHRWALACAMVASIGAANRFMAVARPAPSIGFERPSECANAAHVVASGAKNVACHSSGHG